MGQKNRSQEQYYHQPPENYLVPVLNSKLISENDTVYHSAYRQ